MTEGNVLSWLKRLWRWIKRHWKWIVGGLGIAVAILFGISYRRNPDKSEIQKHKINVLKAEREVAHLQGKREMIRKQEDVVSSDIEKIEEEIKKVDEKILNSREEIKRFTAKEKLKKFKDLGY